MDRADIWPRPAKPVEPEPSRWILPEQGPNDDSGMVAIGADLEPGTLLTAYRSGLFPMPIPRRRIGWFSPDPRGIIPLEGLRVTRSLRRSLRRYTVGFDRCFAEVMANCGDPRRPSGWIDQSMIDAYTRLHRMGWAHSVEVWNGNRLVGGLYGVCMGRMFFGESMFSAADNASKFAMLGLTSHMLASGLELMDCQVVSPHLLTMGAITIPRNEFRKLLNSLCAPPSPFTDWPTNIRTVPDVLQEWFAAALQ